MDFQLFSNPQVHLLAALHARIVLGEAPRDAKVAELPAAVLESRAELHLRSGAALPEDVLRLHVPMHDPGREAEYCCRIAGKSMEAELRRPSQCA